MPPISPPPSTNQRVAATSALPASTRPTDGHRPIESILFTVFKVTLAIFFFMHILLGIVCIRRLFLLQTSVPSNAAQPASPPVSDDTTDISSVDLGPVVVKPVAFAYIGVAFFTIFLLFLILGLDLIKSGPRPPDFHRESPIATRRGLDLAVIKTFPIIIYSAIKMHKIGEASLECSVCLNCFKDDDKLCLIPKCDHAFHPDCIGKWLASHTTCPVCRANLALLPAVHSATQLAESRTMSPQVEVKVEAAPSDGGASERSRREGGREQIQPPDLWDKSESGSFNDRNRARGLGRIRRFPRSHSTGHSLVQPSKNTERFTLRLSTMVRKQLMDRPGPLPPLEVCPGQGYLCGGEGSSRGRYHFRYPDQLDRAAMSERWDFNRSSPTVVADGGGGSPEVRFNRGDRPFNV